MKHPKSAAERLKWYTQHGHFQPCRICIATRQRQYRARKRSAA